MEKCPDPFPIPRFRADTEQNLAQRKLADDDRRYMVRVLATVLCTYVQKPSVHDCEIVSKSLVAKFQFLKEYVSILTNYTLYSFIEMSFSYYLGVVETFYVHKMSKSE